MILGTVTDEGVPVVLLPVAGQQRTGIIDTGFNGDVELPERLRADVNARYIGRIASVLGSGQRVEDDFYLVEFPFDGQIHSVEATFARSHEVLIGTHLLRPYRLTIDFPRQIVRLEAAEEPASS